MVPTHIRSVPTLVTAAINLAATVHTGQLDRQGAPYIGHPARVAASFPDDLDATIVGWLHDVLEKSPTTAEELQQTFPAHIVAAVVAISREPEESLESYCARTAENPLAQRVKFADLQDNSDPQRLAVLPKDVQQKLIAQYRQTEILLTKDTPAPLSGLAFQYSPQTDSTYRVAG